MNFLRRLLARLFSSPPAVPAWADFFTQEQYRRFLRHIGDHFRKQKQKITVGDGIIILQNPPREGFQQLGLLNLAQLCARNEEKEWPDIIKDHFKTLQKSQSEQAVLEQRIADFDRVEELLAVRLWPENYLAELNRNKFVHRCDLPGTLTALVFDLPSSVRNVTPEEAKAWGKSHEELFAIGLANVRENCIPDVTEQDLGDEVVITILSDAENFFVASHALLLEEHPECIGTFGTLIGVPHRHVVLAYPIEDRRVVAAISLMIPPILVWEKEGPGSISPYLYWYKDGEFTNLPFKIKDQSLHFTPPDNFVDVLNMLNEPEI